MTGPLPNDSTVGGNAAGSNAPLNGPSGAGAIGTSPVLVGIFAFSSKLPGGDSG
jgi:hypothetical protein